MELRDIMTRNVEIVSIDSSLKVAATKMRELDVGLIPVCDGDRLQGMVSDQSGQQPTAATLSRRRFRKLCQLISHTVWRIRKSKRR